MYCSKCGKEIKDDAEFCAYCGCRLASDGERKSWISTFLLCWLLGIFGAHRFYTGYVGIGIAQILTLGGCGIWSLIDFIAICFNKFKDSKNNELTEYIKPLGIAMFLILVIGGFLYFFVFPFSILNLSLKTNELEFSTGAKKAVATLNQALTMNMALDGKEMKNLNSEQLTNYFAKNMSVKNKISKTKFETSDGFTYEFKSTGSCSNGHCSVLVDTNGNKEPNIMWTSNGKPQDQIVMTITKTEVKPPAQVLH